MCVCVKIDQPLIIERSALDFYLQEFFLVNITNKIAIHKNYILNFTKLIKLSMSCNRVQVNLKRGFSRILL